MPASYPTSIVSFTTHSTGDTIQAADTNNPDNEIVAIETGLLSGFQHVLKPLNDNTYDIGTTALNWKDLYMKGNIKGGVAWTAVTFAAGNFTASAGNWTVASGDVLRNKYILIGKTLIWTVAISSTTSVSATPNTLRIAVPTGTPLNDNEGVYLYVDNGTFNTGLWNVSGSSLQLFVQNFGNNWQTAASTTGLRGTFIIELT